MSKFALESLTDVLRTEVAHMGVSVTMINPGYIKTKIGAKQIGEHSSHNALTAEQVQLYDTFLPCLESRRIKADEAVSTSPRTCKLNFGTSLCCLRRTYPFLAFIVKIFI